MALQAYIDDSRSDLTGKFVLAGYVASAEQWAAFSREWEELLPLACQDKKGNHRFKMSEMRANNRDIRPFYNVIAKHVEASVSCIVDMPALAKGLDGLTAQVGFEDGRTAPFDLEPFRQHWRDPNFFAFRALMDTFHRERTNKESPLKFGEEKVDFYFDEWGKKGFIRQIWDEYLELRDDEFREMYGKEPRFESDDEFLPLQAADFRAWWVRHWAEQYGLDFDKWDLPFPDHPRKIPHLIMGVTDEQIGPLMAKAIGEAIERYFAKGGVLIPRAIRRED